MVYYIEYYGEIILRLVVACVLGGIIGIERESSNRPAGFRTHILVCIGSALVMITSEFLFENYGVKTNMDPARLGAQVISGIGFLGAGTIIRDGINVRGLTTAASLWAVACVGLAAGIGFYGGAIAAAALIFITLILLKKLEYRVSTKYRTVMVVTVGRANVLGSINDVFEKYGLRIKNMEYIDDEKKEEMILKFTVKTGIKFKCDEMIKELKCIEGISKAYEE